MDRKLVFSFYGRDVSAGRTMNGLAGRTDTLRSRSLAAAKAVGVLAGGAALAGLAKTLRTGFAELQDYEGGLSQLRAGLKSTRGASNTTVKGLEDLASSIQDYSGQTDDSIVKTEALLLTFPQIRNEAGKTNDIFDQTVKVAADMAARMGTDAPSAAIKLGKALNDPAKGLTALTRVGVVFSAQQVEQVKKLEASGRTLDAQKIILRELNKEFGGSAKLYGRTLPGQIERTKREFENVSQELATDLLPYALRFTKWVRKDALPALEDFGGWVKGHKTQLEWFAGIVGGLAVGFKAFKGVRSIQALVGKGPLAGGGGLLGAASKARPVPVFVTNPGFGGPGVAGKSGKAGFFSSFMGSGFEKLLKGGAAAWLGFETVKTVVDTKKGSDAGGALGAVGGAAKDVGGALKNLGGLAAPLGHLYENLGGIASRLGGMRKSAKDTTAAVDANADALFQFNKFAAAVPGSVTPAEQALRDLRKAMQGAAADARATGGDIMGGLIQGLHDRIPELEQEAQLVAATTIKQMRLAADAHSPSRETMKLGKDLADGLYQGFFDAKVFDKFSVETRRGLMRLSRDVQEARAYYKQIRSSLTDYAGIGSMQGQTDSLGASYGRPNVRAYLKQQAHDLKRFAHLLKRLDRMGLDRALLAQFAQAGPDAIPAMEDLIASGERGVAQADRLENQIQRYARQTASFAATDRYGSEIRTDLHRLPNSIERAVIRGLRHSHFEIHIGKLDRKSGRLILDLT